MSLGYRKIGLIRMIKSLEKTLIGLACIVMLCACPVYDGLSAEEASDTPKTVAANDPLEPINRAIFGFNMGVDKLVLRPIALTYRTIVPSPFRTGIFNFLNNLRSPLILINNVLQGDLGAAMVTTKRFVINSTLGVGGLFDPASSKFNLKYRNEDFGQTFGSWGVSEGPYLVLPILGPAPPRDFLGKISDFVVDPLNIYAYSDQSDEWITATRSTTRAVDARSRNVATFDDLEKSALDFYASIRSFYRQKRNAEITNSQTTDDSVNDASWEDLEY